MATMSLKEFEKKIKRWAKTQPELLENALKTAAEIVRGEAIIKHLSGPKMARGKGSLKNATLARRSGDLAGSINTKVSVTRKRQTAQVGTNMKYARIHEKGGVILPKKGKYLVFSVGGHTVFARSVKMPKRPFLSPSLEAKRQKILDIMLDRLIEGYKKS